MMRGVPALVVFVPLEHGKIHDPEEFELFRVEQLVAVVVLLCGEEAEAPARLVDELLRTGGFWLARPSGDPLQTDFRRPRALARAGPRGRHIRRAHPCGA